MTLAVQLREERKVSSTTRTEWELSEKHVWAIAIVFGLAMGALTVWVASLPPQAYLAGVNAVVASQSSE